LRVVRGLLSGPGMRLPDRAIHVVLFVAALATVATSQPEEDRYELRDGDHGLVPAGGSRHAVVSLNRQAVEEAEEIAIEFGWPEGQFNDVMTIVPDDGGIEPQMLTDLPIEMDATSVCAGRDRCSLGFTIEQPNEASGTIVVTAHLFSSVVFSDDAVVTVVFDDE
jgi:hypothetical protein